MQTFLSCDWGTSSFRLRLIDAPTQSVIAEMHTQQGISAIYDAWKTQQTISRFLFYSNYISAQIRELEQQANISLHKVPLIIAGMASSAIGMKELPYKKIPFVVQPQNLLVDIIEATASFPHKTILISGVSSSTDVMRGEETILAGCAINKSFNKQLFILPGTHSKHVLVENEMLADIKTYMTGELFQLLSTKSILAGSVEKNNMETEANDIFIKGVRDATASSVLNNIFQVRINTLFNAMGKNENYYYLSGLLIGEELKQLMEADVEAVTIVSSGNLLRLYQAAVSALDKKITTFVADADTALINAQTMLFNHYKQILYTCNQNL
ncbi:2-dehydro-3-deoxygalactonokinase [Parafilimonas sp.]|uniref:2-dehydro-3-deoxygalactonokinase n=1 Tax=Parafilimonas sp. TaxID=1969739 RepID=UPI0039E6FFAE